MRSARAQLTPANMQALELYGLLAMRVVYDFQLQLLVFNVLGLQMTRVEALGLLEQLGLIHELRYPVTQREGGES